MIFISGIISIIIQKDTLCTNKIRVIYLLPELSQFFIQKRSFFHSFFFFRGGGGREGRDLPPQSREHPNLVFQQKCKLI